MATSTPESYDLTCDQRLMVLTCRSLGMKYEEIAAHLHITQRQVQHACEAGHPTPKKRSGRPRILTEEQTDQLIKFVTSSSYTRRLPLHEVARLFQPKVSEKAIRHALKSRGYSRY